MNTICHFKGKHQATAGAMVPGMTAVLNAVEVYASTSHLILLICLSNASQSMCTDHILISEDILDSLWSRCICYKHRPVADGEAES